MTNDVRGRSIKGWLNQTPVACLPMRGLGDPARVIDPFPADGNSCTWRTDCDPKLLADEAYRLDGQRPYTRARGAR